MTAKVCGNRPVPTAIPGCTPRKTSSSSRRFCHLPEIWASIWPASRSCSTCAARSSRCSTKSTSSWNTSSVSSRVVSTTGSSGSRPRSSSLRLPTSSARRPRPRRRTTNPLARKPRSKIFVTKFVVSGFTRTNLVYALRVSRRYAITPSDASTLAAYLREIAKLPRLTPDEERDLGGRIQRDRDDEALARLVECNLRFVVSYAKRYRGFGLPFLDLIHEGNLGLIEAARRFDPSRNVKFITYAVWWVREAMMHVLADQTRAFSFPPKLFASLHNATEDVSLSHPVDSARRDAPARDLGDLLALDQPPIDHEMIRQADLDELAAA